MYPVTLGPPGNFQSKSMLVSVILLMLSSAGGRGRTSARTKIQDLVLNKSNNPLIANCYKSVTANEDQRRDLFFQYTVFLFLHGATN